VGISYAGDRQVWMKRSLFAREAHVRAFIFQGRLKLDQLARMILDSDPENTWLTARRKSAAASDDDFEWFNFARGALSGLSNGFNSGYRSVSEKLQGQVKVILTNPTRSTLGVKIAQAIDVFNQLSPHTRRQLNGDEHSPLI